MALRKVASMGHPVLRKVAEPVPEADIKSPRIQSLIDDMIETMAEYDGRGLAAPQVHESLQLLIMIWDFDPAEEPYLLVLINPKIEHLTEETSTFWEGCLSLPGLIGKVSRPNRIRVEALDSEGKKLNFIAEDFAATVVQHETDHLNGTLYIDRIENTKDFAFTKEYQKYIARVDQTPTSKD